MTGLMPGSSMDLFLSTLLKVNPIKTTSIMSPTIGLITNGNLYLMVWCLPPLRENKCGYEGHIEEAMVASLGLDPKRDSRIPVTSHGTSKLFMYILLAFFAKMSLFPGL